MSIASFFGFPSHALSGDTELPEIFPLSLTIVDFVNTDVLTVYGKILTDCVERTQGVDKKLFPLLWDNCLQSESSNGLVSLLSKAMTDKRDLFLVYVKAVNVLRLATATEISQIRNDYQSKGSSDVGIFVSFSNYKKTDIVKIYSGMEYCVLASLNKMANLSKAIQFKMNDMRSSVGLTDASLAIDQAKKMATALGKGKDIMMDAKDLVDTSKPDISSIKESIAFLDSKRCFYYGMPLSYVNGEQTAGIGSTGEADAKAVERGLKQYFISILKPVLDALFEIDVTFKSDNFRQITSALDTVKTFDLIGTELISQEDKKLIVQKLFDLNAGENG